MFYKDFNEIPKVAHNYVCKGSQCLKKKVGQWNFSFGESESEKSFATKSKAERIAIL